MYGHVGHDNIIMNGRRSVISRLYNVTWAKNKILKFYFYLCFFKIYNIGFAEIIIIFIIKYILYSDRVNSYVTEYFFHYIQIFSIFRAY